MSESLARLSTAVVVAIMVGLFTVAAYYWLASRMPISSLMVLVPALFGTLLLGVLFSKPLIRLLSATILLSTFALVSLGELIIAFASEDSLVRAVDTAASSGKPFDDRSKLQVAKDLSRDGNTTVAGFTPAFLRQAGPDGSYQSILEVEGVPTFVFAGISSTNTVLCNETGEYALYLSDEFGFNNPHGLWNQPKIDVVGVGDSVVMGHCVEREDNLFAPIRKTYPAALNLGFSGNSPLYALASLLEYAADLEPAHVLWFYSTNDLEWYEVGKDRETPGLLRYMEPGYTRGLKELQPTVDDVLASYVATQADHADNASIVALAESIRQSWVQRVVDGLTFKRTRSALFVLDQRLQNDVEERQAQVDNNLFFYRNIVTRAKTVVQSWGGQLYLVYMPAVEEFEGKKPGRYHPFLTDLAADLEIPFVDAHRALAAQENPQALYSLPQRSAVLLPHMTADGYRLVGEHVRMVLQEHAR